ncbi:gliding motility protein GldN [Mucilaginibacter sp. HMF5004]|uniref:type IX secretion system ring protein PorN/GldN n=1 Tax=Mucilaginibacter rivuli TaxID=2857527 RepID=UPI001C5E00A4|nr:gliding motility protein GldN [Mucilaginibacter rivuli]MBW4889109.1 gliding motility protein GldN [Mucilaginibacter rivuli]
MKKLLFLIIFIVFGNCLAVVAQITAYYGPDSTELAAFKRDSIKSISLKQSINLSKARPFPLPASNIKEVKFYHRYWRDIDLNDPQNKIMIQPGATLIEATLAALKNGVITAYDPTPGTPTNPNGDSFSTPLTYQQIMSQLADTVLVDQFDKDGNKTGSIQKANNFTPDKVSGFRIKEDVYFDKVRSRVITRIVGIAPLLKLNLSSGDSLGSQPLCWFRFSQFRKVLVTMEIDTLNKKTAMSMDDVFLQRRFSSKIFEESNPMGNRIKDYATAPADIQKEQNRIEHKLMAYKDSLWGYSLFDIEVEGALVDYRTAERSNSAKYTAKKTDSTGKSTPVIK